MTPDDGSRAAILARRARFFSAALAATAGCGGAATPAKSGGAAPIVIDGASPGGEPSERLSAVDEALPERSEKTAVESDEPALASDGSRPCPPGTGKDPCRVVVISSCFTMLLEAVTFASRSSKPSAGSGPLLDETAEALRKYPDYGKLNVIGHTDDTEPKKLGLERAEAVRDELVKRGVDPAQLGTKNAGKSRPLQSGKSAAARAANRRVEFKFEP